MRPSRSTWFPRVIPMAIFVAAFAYGAPAIADTDSLRATASSDEGAAPGERELLGRLVAPCCWNQTLDVHAGGAPDALRREIRARLRAGETPASIEEDFVARFGERVRAGSTSSTLGSAGIAVIVIGIAAAGMLALRMRRWLRAAKSRETTAELPQATTTPDELDGRLDAELRAMD